MVASLISVKMKGLFCRQSEVCMRIPACNLCTNVNVSAVCAVCVHDCQITPPFAAELAGQSRSKLPSSKIFNNNNKPILSKIFIKFGQDKLRAEPFHPAVCIYTCLCVCVCVFVWMLFICLNCFATPAVANAVHGHSDLCSRCTMCCGHSARAYYL